jgi:hypothetical protein
MHMRATAVQNSEQQAAACLQGLGPGAHRRASWDFLGVDWCTWAGVLKTRETWPTKILFWLLVRGDGLRVLFITTGTPLPVSAGAASRPSSPGARQALPATPSWSVTEPMCMQAKGLIASGLPADSNSRNLCRRQCSSTCTAICSAVVSTAAPALLTPCAPVTMVCRAQHHSKGWSATNVNAVM